jgi:hypothetical protein
MQIEQQVLLHQNIKVYLLCNMMQTHVDDALADILDPGWFKIFRGKAVRQNLNPFLEAKKALGISESLSVLARPPAGDSVAQACKRPFRKPGDDIDCFIGIKVSIKTVSPRGLGCGDTQPKFGPPKPWTMQTMCLYKEKVETPLSEGIFPQYYLGSLLGSWWEGGARFPQAKAAAATELGEMGDRYDNQEGGGSYGRDDGGSIRQQSYGGYKGNNFQRPPFSRPGKFGGTQYQNSQ